MTEPIVRPPFDDADADIIFRSADLVDFRLYKVVLAKASSVFRGMFSLPDVNAEKREPQVVSLAEDADTLERLLRLFYPVMRPRFTTADELIPVLLAAKKYDIEVATDAARGTLEELVQKELPSRAYAIACFLEMPALVGKAARLLIREADVLSLPVIPSDLRSLAPSVLYAFGRYRSQCLSAVRSVLAGNDAWLRDGDHSYYTVEHKEYKKKSIPIVQTSWIWYRCSDTACAPNAFARFCAHPLGTPLARTWFLYYKTMVKEKLLCGGLDGRVVMEEKLLKQVLAEAEKCCTCAPLARVHLVAYAQALEKRIESALDEVPFDISFADQPSTSS